MERVHQCMRITSALSIRRTFHGMALDLAMPLPLYLPSLSAKATTLFVGGSGGGHFKRKGATLMHAPLTHKYAPRPSLPPPPPAIAPFLIGTTICISPSFSLHSFPCCYYAHRRHRKRAIMARPIAAGRRSLPRGAVACGTYLKRDVKGGR